MGPISLSELAVVPLLYGNGTPISGSSGDFRVLE